jgi:hypothetical protein
MGVQWGKNGALAHPISWLQAQDFKVYEKIIVTCKIFATNKVVSWNRSTFNLVSARLKLNLDSSIYYLFIGKRSVGRPQARWSDDLRRTAGRSCMRIAEDRARWREVGETFVQQWTVVG